MLIHPTRPGRWAAGALVLAGLTGCASLSPDRGFGPVAQTVQDRLGVAVHWARTPEERERIDARVAELLQQPLSMDAAVQLALLNNRGLQASFEALGMSQAELVQAGRWPNPGFGIGRSRQGEEIEWERGLHLSLGRLIALPLLQQVEARRFAQAQGAAALAVLTLAADTRKAWVMAVGAEETVRYSRQVMQAADASAELARRMAAVGNFNALQQAREQSFYAEAALNLARAEQARLAARERLTRHLGLWGEQVAYRLPERLPDLPAAPRDQPDIERVALAQRLDVQSARLAVDQTARNLGLTRVTRWVNVFELGLLQSRSNEAPVKRGWELSFELPVFDSGDARLAKAEHIAQQAVHQAAHTAIQARSEVRQAYGHYRFAWDMAKHQRDEIVPLKQRISEQNLLRYNGMLIGVFELLADARSQIASVQAAIDALRDFWIAQADLDMALVGTPGLGPAPTLTAPTGEPAGAGH